MIAILRGVVAEAGADSLVLDVGGVGYLVQASARTLAALGGIGEPATLFTAMQVSENDMRLIGFSSREERDWFGHLTAIQGVGSKVALALFSVLTVDELRRAVASGDAASVARAQGVGPKLAQRIVHELKAKAGDLAAIGGGAATVPAGGPAADALAALAALGFRPAEAARAVDAALADAGEGATLDTVVRLALRKVGQ